MDAENKITESPPKGKPKAQLKHVLFDSDFFDKPKIKALGYDHGQLAILYLMRLYAALSRATDATIERSAARGIAYEMHLEIDKADEIVNYCASKGILLIEGDNISSERVRSDQEKLGEQQEKWRDKQRKSRECLKSVSGDIPERIPESLNTEVLKIEDLNLDPKKIAKPPDPPPTAIKISEKLYLDPVKYDLARMEFAKFDLEPNFWIPRAAIHVEGWLAKPENRASDTPEQWYYHLVKWGIQQCMKDRGEKIRTDNAKAVQKKITPVDNRPKIKSVHEVMKAQGIPTKGAA